MGRMMRVVACVVLLSAFAFPAMGQTPQPFPRGGGGQPESARPANTAQAPNPATAQAVPAAAQPTTPADPNAPSTATVGFPIFPGSQFLAAYDAGKGQRYFLYGSTKGYLELVKWYQTQLRDKGDEVFAEPATHMFAQRFREETMAFPPGVTVKDWTSGGSKGYPNPKLGAQPALFPSVIMIVPPLPPAQPAGR
jgi:hypothetical protein